MRFNITIETHWGGLRGALRAIANRVHLWKRGETLTRDGYTITITWDN